MDTQLVRFTQWAEQHPQARYNALMGLLSRPGGLLHSFEVQPGNKASAVGVRIRPELGIKFEILV